MKHVRSILVLIVSIFLLPSAFGNAIVEDQFVNYATGQLGASGSGGTGNIPGWFNNQSTVTITNGSGSLNGTGLGLVASTGDKVSISATPLPLNLGCYNKFVPANTLAQTNPGNVYYSFLYRFNVATDVTNVGQIISQVNRQNSGLATGIHWYLIAKQSGGVVSLGIAKPGGTTTNFAATTVTAGQTFFVVVRQQIITGTANDIDDLWINPPVNTFGTNEANVPAVSATTSDGSEDQSTTGAGRFWVASGADANLDELRIATNWADVTPPLGQCIAAGVATDPQSVTQCAEISARFSVDANGTSPTFQWQLSQNGGASWNNIPGAIFDTFTTPNLQLATDQGNQYRAIITVPCNGSSATSAVASVTLTAPIVSPAGLVMDDQFADQFVGDPPVTTNNSVWFTAVAANFSAFPGPGVTATPVAGGSSLWLGYFVNLSTNLPNTNRPIHLAIGNTLQVTLPFTPESFSSHTNNAALRFGLYDYSDGGTPLTADDTTAGGSTGNGQNVRGYMLSLDFGQNFSANSPLQLLARNGLTDVNLMGTTGDYLSLGSGPSGGGFSNAPAFQAGVQYTLVFDVTRTDTNVCDISTTITGGGTNWTFSVTETNFAYHRFDAFGMRPNSLETSADSFFFPEFKVEVIPPVHVPITNLPPFSITGVKLLTPTSVQLTWASTNGISYQVQSRASLSTGSWASNATVLATGPVTVYTNSPVSGSQNFFRIAVPLPQ